MFYLGRTGEPLIDEDFEAWDYGPVVPSIYHKTKFYGNKPIKKDIFICRNGLSEADERFIENIYDVLKGKTASQLVSISHIKGGAWYKKYNPKVNGIIIPQQDILEEYNEHYARE
jgi:uncharacterized phage-associated protein